MFRQLDILALEPFHGGARRAMLEAISRYSRHRWRILKLPARRLERRLLVAATWFAEYLSRHKMGNVDVLFCSEAMNLADLFRLRPKLARTPSVVYFHENQLPDPNEARAETPTDLVNLNSATAATEIWFNSTFNLRTFLGRASGMVGRHPELRAHNPMAGLTAKAHLVPPPIDIAAAQASSCTADRDPYAVVFDARGADHALLCAVLRELDRRYATVHVTTIGHVRGLPASVRPVTLDERRDSAHVNALLASGLLVTTRDDAASDDLAVRALAAGCTPIVPRGGAYPELLPRTLHESCMHDGTAESIADRIIAAWDLERHAGVDMEIDDILARHDAIDACKVIDRRLQNLAMPLDDRLSTATVEPALAGGFTRD